MKRKFTSTVAGASILLTGVGLLTRGLGMVREMVFAGSFGLGEQFDIYLVGAVLPLTIQIIILFLIQNHLIPSYNQLLSKSPEQEEDFVRTNFWVFSIAGIVLALILYLSSSFIIKLYLPSSSYLKQEEAKQIFNLFLLTLPVSASSSVLIAYLQNKLDFFTPAGARLSINFAVIIVVFLFSAPYGITIIPIGFFIGGLIQFFILLFKTDIKLFTSLNKLMIGTHVRSSLSFNLGLIIIIETLSQLYAVADRYFVNSVETGGIAALNYAQTLFILPITTISLALSTALFPNLSKSYSSDDRDELEKKFYSGIRINILIFIPIMLVFIFFGNEIIAIIYERGKFGSSDTIMTAEALKYFSISIVFYSIYSVFNKIFYSAKWIKMLLVITICGIFFKILLNFILVKSLAQNGLALSSSISYTLFFLLSLLIIQKKLSFKIVKNLFLEIVFHLICAALSYLIIILLVGNVSGSMVITFSSILLFVFIYVLNLWILKSHSIRIISNLLYSRGLLK